MLLSTMADARNQFVEVELVQTVSEQVTRLTRAIAALHRVVLGETVRLFSHPHFIVSTTTTTPSKLVACMQAPVHPDRSCVQP